MLNKIFILNGCNLHSLGKREPLIYGKKTLAEIKQDCEKEAASLGFDVDFRQTNHEGDLIDWIYEAGEQSQALILNAGAWTHTSISLYDAICAQPPSFKVIEVHLSNIYARESFRARSMVAPVCFGMIYGLGDISYILALRALLQANETKQL